MPSSSCPNCGEEWRTGGCHRIDSTGFGAGNDTWTWYCSVWCRDASYGIAPMFRALRQTKLSDFEGAAAAESAVEADTTEVSA